MTALPLYKYFRTRRFKESTNAGAVAFNAKEYGRAEELYRRSLSYYPAHRPKQQGQIACAHNLGMALLRQHKYEEAAARFEEVAGECSSRAPHWDLVLNSLALLAEAYWALGRYREPVTLFNWALDFIAEHPSSVVRLSAFHNGLGLAYLHLGEYGRALDNLTKSVELERKMDGDPEKASTLARFNLGVLYQRSGELEQAEQIEQEVLAIREKRSGRTGPRAALVIANLASLRYEQKRYEEAEALAREALSSVKKEDGRASVLHTLALLCVAAGRLEEADTLFEQARAIRVGLLARDHPKVLSLEGDIGVLRIAQGRLAEAEELLTAARRSLEMKLGARHPYLAAVQYRLGMLRVRQGRSVEARDLFEAALSIKTRTAPRHPETEDCRKALKELAQ